MATDPILALPGASGSSALADADRTVLQDGLPGRLPDDDRCAARRPRDRRRATVKDIVDERDPLVDEGLAISVEEEVLEVRPRDSSGGVDTAVVLQDVLRGRHARAAEDLDPLVVAVHRLAAVVDRRDGPVRMREHDDGRVDVASGADGGIDQHRSPGEDLDYRRTDHEARHVEVMDRHVDEDAAAVVDVPGRRERRVPARDARQLHLPDLAGLDGRAHRPMSGVEPPVEADHERHSGPVDSVQRAIHLRDVEADGLLAEDRLARLCRPDDEVDMRLTRGADGDRIDVRRLDELVNRQGPDLQFGGDLRRRVGERVSHRHDASPWHLPSQDRGMHSADPTDARDTHPDGPHMASLSTAARLRARVGAPVGRLSTADS